MLPPFEITLSGLAAILSTFAAGKAFIWLAETGGVSSDMPNSFTVFGPWGVLVLGGSVIGYLLARLAKADTREDARRVEHETTIATLVELGTSSKMVIEQNSKILEEVKVAVTEVRGTVSACKGRPTA
jgi:hypothetical protein